MVKEIRGYSNYTIDECGNIFSKRYSKYIKQNTDKNGYKYVNLSDNKNLTTFKVHRLVAMHFIDNTENKEQVNHLDCNKANNHFKNLEWCTAKENTQHAIKNGLRKNIQNILANINKKTVIDTNTGVFYDSILEASRFSNFKYSALKAMLTGQNKNKSTFRYI